MSKAASGETGIAAAAMPETGSRPWLEIMAAYAVQGAAQVHDKPRKVTTKLSGTCIGRIPDGRARIAQTQAECQRAPRRPVPARAHSPSCLADQADQGGEFLLVALEAPQQDCASHRPCQCDWHGLAEEVSGQQCAASC